jgi:hypothetical protein
MTTDLRTSWRSICNTTRSMVCDELLMMAVKAAPNTPHGRRVIIAVYYAANVEKKEKKMDDCGMPTRPTGIERWALNWMLVWFWVVVLLVCTLLLAGLLALFGTHLHWLVVLSLWHSLLVAVAFLIAGTFVFAVVADVAQKHGRPQ